MTWRIRFYTKGELNLSYETRYLKGKNEASVEGRLREELKAQGREVSSVRSIDLWGVESD